MSFSELPEKNKQLVWRVHPLFDKPLQSLVLVVLLLLILFLINLNFPEPGWTTLATIILLLSLGKYFIATTYEIDNTGITVKFMGIKRKFRWETYRRYESCPNGLFLSPFQSPHRLDNFRGLFLLYGRNRDEVIAFVQNRLQTI